ncbi:MAG: hypothetical protein QXG65_04145 [Thermoplasmata archaeon]
MAGGAPLAAVAGLAAAGFALYFFFGSFWAGAGFEPTGPRTARAMLAIAGVGPDDTVVDLGAGCGALVLRAVRERGARAVAVEIEPIRRAILRGRRRRLPDPSRLTVVGGSLFDADLTGARVILTFLWPSAMARLRPKLEAEVAPGTWIVSHAHPIPGWVPVRTDGAILAYRWPESRPRSEGMDQEPDRPHHREDRQDQDSPHDPAEVRVRG